VTASLNEAPAVWLPGFATVKELAEPAPTARSIVPVVLLELSVAVKVTLWVSKSVMLAALAPVAIPLTKLTEDPLPYGKLSG
jgi:hypothetical protein